MRLIKDYHSEIVKMTLEGKRQKEIAEKLKFSKAGICKYLKKIGVKYRGSEITKSQYELIIGSLLGDSTLIKCKTSENFEFVCQHGLKQKEYAIWKYNKLKSIRMSYYEYTRKTPNKITGKYYSCCVIRAKTNKRFDILEKLFYRNRVKFINIDVLESYYTPLALSIHYMDDGYLIGRNYNIATCGFSKECVLNLSKFLLNKYGLFNIVTKDNRIRIRACSAETFTSIIYPYITQVPSLMYKCLVT